MENPSNTANYKPVTESGDCIFCAIAEGKMHTPGIFWENKNYMAFLSIFPNTEGFSVVIPKKHKPSDVLSLPEDELSEFIVVAKKVAKILEDTFEDVGRVGLIMEGTGVDHAHIKLVPMHQTQGLSEGKWQQVHSSIDNYFEKYEGYISSHDSKKASDDEIKNLAIRLKRTDENNSNK